MRLVSLVLTAVVVGGAGVFAFKIYNEWEAAPPAEEKMVTFTDENGVTIHASEDILLGKKDVMPKREGTPRIFTKPNEKTYYKIYKGMKIPPAEQGWVETPYDPVKHADPPQMDLPAKYRAYLERQKGNAGNSGGGVGPQMKAEGKQLSVVLPDGTKVRLYQHGQNGGAANGATTQYRVGAMKPFGGGAPPLGESITLKIPTRPKDPIDAYYYKQTVGQFIRKHSGEGKARDQAALDTMELFCRVIGQRGATNADVVMSWLSVEHREPIADLLYELAESDLLVDQFSVANIGPRFVVTTAELERLGYSPFLICLGHISAAKEILYYNQNNPEGRKPARRHVDRAEALLPEVLADTEMPASCLERLLDQHHDNLNDLDGNPEARMLKLLDFIEKKRPDIAPLCKGSFYLEHGWRARGTGFADTVTQEGWKKLEECLAISHKNLEQAWKLQPSSRVCELMLSVCRGQGKAEEGRMWFHRGLELTPDSVDLRSNFMQSLCAKWQGSDEEMFAFARENVQRYQRDPALNYRNVYLIQQAHVEAAPRDPHDRADYFKNPKVYGEIRDALKFVVKQKPKAVDAWSWLAFYAIEAGDNATALEAFNHQISQTRFVSTKGFGSSRRQQNALREVRKKLGIQEKQPGGIQIQVD